MRLNIVCAIIALYCPLSKHTHIAIHVVKVKSQSSPKMLLREKENIPKIVKWSEWKFKETERSRNVETLNVSEKLYI